MYTIYHGSILNNDCEMYEIEDQIESMSWLYNQCIHKFMLSVREGNCFPRKAEIYKELKGMNKIIRDHNKFRKIGNMSIWRFGPNPTKNTIEASYSRCLQFLVGAEKYDYTTQYCIENLLLNNFSIKTGTYFASQDRLIIHHCGRAIFIKFKEHVTGKPIKAFIYKEGNHNIANWKIDLFCDENVGDKGNQDYPWRKDDLQSRVNKLQKEWQKDPDGSLRIVKVGDQGEIID